MNHTSRSSSRKHGAIKIAISQGELSGISPEIIASAVKELNDKTLECSIICTNKGKEQIEEELKSYKAKNVEFINPDIKSIPLEYRSSDVLVCLYYAAKQTNEGFYDAIVTAPLDKNKVAENYTGFTGHTGFLKQMFNVKDVLMLMSSPSLKVGIMTEHYPVTDVPKHITPERIIATAKLLNDYLKEINPNPKIAVLGLNPHSGDNGLIGHEEQEIIIPAINELNRQAINASGPIPGDTAFTPSNRDKYDGFLAMYHDQGMIPVKIRGLESVVNITLGLPIIRTSPGHGVAYDIKGKGIASANALLRAIDEASTMVLSRRFK